MATAIVIPAIDEHAISYAVLGLYASHIVNHNLVRHIYNASHPYGMLASVY